jgi:Holliday junction resolvasome RuvABC endonuclease subunit
MLRLPDGAAHIATVVGIDPGSDTLGVGVLYFDLDALEIVGSEAFTLNGTRQGRGTFATEIHGDRLGRIESHREALLQVFRYFEPISIASESPFMSRRMPAAYGALTEVVCAIRHAAMQYDAWKPLKMIDPPTVKRAVGVSGKTGGPEGKKLMLTALLAMPPTELRYCGDVPMESLDEHSIDALAVAYCHLTQLLEELCLRTLKSAPPESSLLSLPGSSTRTIRAGRKSRRSRKKSRK